MELSANRLQQIVKDNWEVAIEFERERCARLVEAMRPAGGRMFNEAQSSCFDALTDAANNIRKQPKGCVERTT